jgi:hypothetical protein
MQIKLFSVSLDNLPTLLAKPLMIFNSRTQPRAFVIIVDIRLNGDCRAVATHCEIHKNLGQMHSVRSIHPRPHREITYWIQQGLLLFEK